MFYWKWTIPENSTMQLVHHHKVAARSGLVIVKFTATRFYVYHELQGWLQALAADNSWLSRQICDIHKEKGCNTVPV